MRCLLLIGLACAAIVTALIPHTTWAITSTTQTPRTGDTLMSSMRSFGALIGFSSTDPRTIVTRLIRTALGFMGIILLLMILSSGVQFMFSGGNTEKIEKAKQTFYNALIGIAIILSAYSIVTFIVGALTTVTK